MTNDPLPTVRRVTEMSPTDPALLDAVEKAHAEVVAALYRIADHERERKRRSKQRQARLHHILRFLTTAGISELRRP